MNAEPATRCRFCASPLREVVADLGVSPLANSLLDAQRLRGPELFFPLKAYVCQRCFLVQIEAFETPDHIFEHYLYFSSYSDSWLAHCERYAEQMIRRLALGSEDEVVEIASNDGYLLQYFLRRGVKVLGVEPARNVAQSAIDKGVPTDVDFFGTRAADRLRNAGHAPRLMVANNVLAHVPDINDFVTGFATLLSADGVATFEFPSLLNLIEQTQFDTIYHEHFSYLSLSVVERIFAAHRLRVIDVEQLVTHGGSLRIYACHAAASHPASERVAQVRGLEAEAGLTDVETYRGFARRIVDIKCEVMEFLIRARREGRSVVAYGAPAKGNTLLNYCGAGPELISFTVDRSPHKQGLWLPGSRIAVRPPEAIFESRPDYLFILPWNLRDEIVGQMKGIRDWGGRFVTAVPRLEVF